MKNLKTAFLMIAVCLAFQIQTTSAQTAAEFLKRAGEARDRADYAEMVKDADGAVKQDPKSGIAYFLRGLGYFLLGKNAEAAADAAQVIELNPTVMEGYFLHGSALLGLRPDDWKISLADFDEAIELDPTYPNNFRERALIHNEFDQNFAAALDDAGQAVKLDSKYADGFYERGRANQNLKNWADAESDYSSAVKLGKNDAAVYNHRGVARFLQNKREDAIADFRQALKLEPNDRQAKENLDLALAKAPATDAGNSTVSAAPQNSQPNIAIPYAFGNSTYEKVMPAAEEIFKKLTTHHYPVPKEVSLMGKTTIVDPFGEDKNKLAIRINSVLQAMRSILESRYVNELTAEQRQLCQERLDKITALQADAARLHLVTLVNEN